MISNLPESIGVYIFKDKAGKPLYIGKSLNIKKRVKDHLSFKNSDYKERILLEKTNKVEAIEVDSEIEALLLEINLIKRYKPTFNTQLKDDKDYLYIKITNDVFPKVLSARKRGLKDARVYFGPFPSASKVSSTLKILRRIFLFSTCKPNQKRACLYYHLNLCPGVCVGRISEREYRKNIHSLTLFLRGKKYKVLEQFSTQLKRSSSKLEFEEAAEIQKRINSLNYILRPVRPTDNYIDEDIESIRRRELADISNILKLKKFLHRIECYDISNIFGKQSTGSMVVFTEGKADKDEYRRFRIKKVTGINDVAMIREVVERRFNNNWKRPDLIIVDGGRAQLNSALSVVNKFNLNTPVISLATKKFIHQI